MGCSPPPAHDRRVQRHLDHAALDRVRAFLDAERSIVRSADLEAVSGLSRFELARQFRARFGTSPYRYSLVRRLDLARRALQHRASLADIALDGRLRRPGAFFARVQGGLWPAARALPRAQFSLIPAACQPARIQRYVFSASARPS